MSREAYLILENGQLFKGKGICSDQNIMSEIVFNTSMTGYPQVLSSPAYAGQAVVMTYPLVGNYGICFDDLESDRPWLDALIIREAAREPSNFRSDISLIDYLCKHGVPCIEGIDTRALTKTLRDNGTMKGMITSDTDFNITNIIAKLKEHKNGDLVGMTSCRERYLVHGVKSIDENGVMAGHVIFDNDQYEASLNGGPHEKAPSYIKEFNGTNLKIALLDLGEKYNLVRSLTARGCDVEVFPADTEAREILSSHPNGIVVSNGPGDPKECESIIPEIKKLYDGNIPVFAISLGHQLMALATGGNTSKMKHGHRGGNHPVKDLSNGRVYITSQNHGYVVDIDSIDNDVASPAFVNINDGSNEGLTYIHKNIFTVQFQPEACVSSEGTGYLIDMFIDRIKNS
ncbi:MAG: carbamoyl phosphate synthase small subunit [Eubacteriales bacterium]|jgi:carbamoyl-phosphate synthase small subunit